MDFPGLPAPAQPLARTILHGYGRLFFGDELCDRTGIPDTPVKHLISLARPAITLLEHARTRSRTVQALADTAADYRWNTLMPRTAAGTQHKQGNSKIFTHLRLKARSLQVGGAQLMAAIPSRRG
jgi:hypothetical protein